ncbi:MAG: Do family serine endopeptidase [Caulobacterales bacterium]
MAWLLRIFCAALALALVQPVLAQPAFAQTRLPPEGFADLAERLTPAVVNIATTQRVEGVAELPAFPRGSPLERFNDNMNGAAQITSLGSGFIISGDGVVVTNNHVIESADAIEVILPSGERLEANVVGRDPATDLAVLRVQPRAPLPFVQFGDSDRARVGDLVLAVGNPFGLGGTVTVGIVSARNRNIDAGRYDDFIQTDAAINRGNSGGPLFNMAGQVIGVNTAIVSPTGGSVGVGFATPANLTRSIVDQLLRYGEARRGWLGVRLGPVTPEIATRNNLHAPTGAVVRRLTAGGPAQRAGLRAGDIILRFDGRQIADSRALTRYVAEAQIGRTIALEIMRGGRRMALNVQIERLTEAVAAQSEQNGGGEEPMIDEQGPVTGGRVLGMTLLELNAEARRRYGIANTVRGLVVASIDVGSDARNKLLPGDVIVEMSFDPVLSIAQARAAAERAERAGRPVLLHVNRDGAMTFRSVRGRR